MQRADDRPEVVRERLAAYERQTKPLSDYYRRQGVLEIVDGAAEHGGSEPRAGEDCRGRGEPRWSSVNRRRNSRRCTRRA